MSDATWLTLRWTPGHQEIAVDGVAFSHPEPTGTAPSHDIAHLLAAAGGLPWRPRGARDDVCRAEFNAILIEHLCVNVFNAVILGQGALQSVIERTLEHAHWFVTEHYAPFPVSFEAALGEFREGLETEVVVRLSPIFFRQRAFELEHTDFCHGEFSARFCSSFHPRTERLSHRPQRELAGAIVTLFAADGW